MRKLAVAFVLVAASGACSRPETRAPDYPVDRTPPPSGSVAPSSDRGDRGADVGTSAATLPGDAGVAGSDRPDAGAEMEKKGPLSPPDLIDRSTPPGPEDRRAAPPR